LVSDVLNVRTNLNSRIKLEESEKGGISIGATNYLEPKLPVSKGF
jgi:hypothetical protein